MVIARLPALAAAPTEGIAPPLARLEASLRAVERAIRDLGIDAPHTLRSPLPVEEARCRS